VCCLIVLSTFLSCNPDVEICYDAHPLRAYIDFKYKWTTDDPKPDSMRIIAYRRVNTLKYKIMTTAKESGNVGTIQFPSEEIDDSELETTGTTPLWLRSGEYELFAYSGVPDMAVDNSEVFLEENEDPDSIKFKFTLFPTTDMTPSLAEYSGWIDSNPYSGFMVTGEQPIYTDKRLLNVPNDKHNQHIECLFVPNTINSQKVNVRFTISPKEEGIVIDYVHAEMAGAASQVMIGTGTVLIENTGKILFTPSFTPQGTEAAVIQVNGSFFAAGLVRATSKNKVVGPGILQLNIHAHITQTKPDGSPYTMAKNFRANINLYKTLTENPSLKYDPSRNGFVQTQPEITLDIGQTLEITREKVLSHPESSVDYWIDAEEYIYLDI
jgi:hypothetical protein